MKTSKALQPRSVRGAPQAAVFIAVTAAWLSMLGGCGGSRETASAAPAGSLGGVIRYDGLQAVPGRPLAIALYRSFPPSGPPIATKLIERFEVPYRYEFTGLAPGAYYVGALIDVDRMDTRHAGMLVPKRDPHGYAGGGAPIHLGISQGAAAVEIVLEDPAE